MDQVFVTFWETPETQAADFPWSITIHAPCHTYSIAIPVLLCGWDRCTDFKRQQTSRGLRENVASVKLVPKFNSFFRPV